MTHEPRANLETSLALRLQNHDPVRLLDGVQTSQRTVSDRSGGAFTAEHKSGRILVSGHCIYTVYQQAKVSLVSRFLRKGCAMV